MVELAVWLPAVLLFFYLVLAGVEFGSVAFLFLGLLPEKLEARAVLNPVWEASNVFLVFALTAYEVSFPQAVPALSRAIAGPVLAAVGCLGARAVCILLAYYGDSRRFFVRLGLLLSSIAAPTLFGASFLVFVGVGLAQEDWTVLGLLVVSGILLLAGSFFWILAGGRRLLGLILPALTVFLVGLALFFRHLRAVAPQLFGGSVDFAWAPLGITLILLACLLLALFFWRGWLFVGSVVSLGVAYFGLVSGTLPYLIYPGVTLQGAATETSTLQILLVANVIGGLVVLPALGLLYLRVLRSYRD